MFICGPCVKRDSQSECEFDPIVPFSRSLPAKNPLVRPRSDGGGEESPRKHPRLIVPSSVRSTLPAPPCFELKPNGVDGRENESEAPFVPHGILESPPRPGLGAFSGFEEIQRTLAQSFNQRTHRKASTIPPSPSVLTGKSDDVEDANGDILIVPELKEAIFQRTDTSKPGFSRLSQYELQRLSTKLKANKGFMRSRPDAKDLILPSRKVADHLLAIYLTREYVNLPIMHLADFQAKYLDLWTSEDLLNDLGVFRGIVNAMLALGCLATDPANQSDASMYFIKSQNLIRFGALDGEDLVCVQAYLISSQYLLAIGNLDTAWKSVGIAIRIAQSLHLHLKSGSQHLKERVDRELARRVWHSCVLLERMIAVHYGKSAINCPLSQAPLPTPLESEYVDVIFGAEPISATDRPSIIEFFTASCRLYERYDDVVSVQDELRISNGRSARKILGTFDPQKLLNADRLLCNWNTALPPFLQSNSPSQGNPIALRQHNILRIRYLHMRLLLYRPLLAMLAADPEIYRPCSPPDLGQRTQQRVDTPLMYIIANNSAIKCILAAREIVDILTKYERVDEKSHHVGPVPSWWDNIGYAFSCATVLLAARMCPSAYDELPENTVEEGWNRCVDLLIRYRSFNSEAVNCLNALDRLSSTVMEIEDEDQVKKEANGVESSVRDVAWLECLPVDLE
ncbi:hypothetical protein PRK78_001227 [Emydomyces testavorans]|uniref:Xylanolytic transcriptional activator regulatory domain-containing protein n=1 Tax=Emydomyces testavorans TaxID=2070801 RepID=A0AAF0DC69_9EURO|nr:hypothetical protein PRK78_001227 [Emydomyces testavorans]